MNFRCRLFYDDELNVSKSMVEMMNGLADLQIRLSVEFRLRGFVKAELFTAEQAAAMRCAGFRWLLCGFEAANPRILVSIEKRADRDDNDRCIEIAKTHGLKVKALMSVGHPGESEDSIGDIRDWLIRSRVDDFDCTVITTYPGTPYYDLAVPHPDQPGIWTYTQARTGDRLHAYDVDYTTTADYYKGDPRAAIAPSFSPITCRQSVSSGRVIRSSEKYAQNSKVHSTRVRQRCDTSIRLARGCPTSSTGPAPRRFALQFRIRHNTFS